MAFWKIWRTLRSRKLAVVLISLLVALCVLGTVVPQLGEGSYGEWRRDSPRIAAFVRYLGLDEIYTSAPFIALVAVLALSTLACALSRLRGSGAPRGQRGLGPLLLSRHRLAGSFVFHVGIVVTLVGGTVSALTRSEDQVTVTEGKAVPVARRGRPLAERPPTGPEGHEFFLVRLDKFHQVLDTRGGLPDYSSDVTVVERGLERKKATVRVNEPFSYRGITFYQGTHGFSPWFMFAQRESGKLFKAFVPLETDLDSDPARYLGSFAVPGTRYVVDMEFFPNAVYEEGALRSKSPEPKNPAASITVRRGEEVVFSGPVARARPVEIEKGVALGLGTPRYWSELTVVKDSGVGLVFVGSWIAVAGLCLRFLPLTMKRREREGSS
ncbi:MAG: cytochrome c biogenesis protein ResB [Planctomycetota bacterium]|jgi:cytochrome c biogenesis protein ResB